MNADHMMIVRESKAKDNKTMLEATGSLTCDGYTLPSFAGSPVACCNLSSVRSRVSLHPTSNDISSVHRWLLVSKRKVLGMGQCT